MPPIENRNMNVSANSSGGWKLMEPLYSVAIQLNTLMALGTATTMVSKENIILPNSLMPLVNIWCAQTKLPNPAIAMLENAMAL